MKVLIVDDSPTMRGLIRSRLERAAYTVSEAASGEAALAEIERDRNISLTTMDVEMAGMDGFETCAAMRLLETRPDWIERERKCPPVLFVTADDSMEGRRKGFEAGAADFIGKRYLESELVPVVDKILKPEGRFRGLRALVVEDSRAYRQIVAQALRQQGLSVSEAGDGMEACKFLSAAPNAYDIIITDYDMPQMDGLALVRRIRVGMGLQGIPVIMLSAVADKVTQIELFKAGASDCISKPFIKEEFLARVAAHLDVSMLNRRLKESVNELKKLNGRLERSKESLEKAARETRELLHVLCHDLANPLGAISLMVDMLEGPEMFKESKWHLKLLADNGLEIIDLVRKMRALEEGKMKLELHPMEAGKLMEESAFMLKDRFKAKGVGLELDAEPGLLVSVEPVTFVNSVLNNLMTNAVKFSRPGSKVVAKAFREGSSTVITIRDFGIGMPPNILETVFSLGKPTNREGTAGETGTGFGMPLVKKFVESYGGSISLWSKEEHESPGDHGVEVRMEFPPTP